MKFICNRDLILKELELANNFTSQKNTFVINSNVLLENFQNTLIIKSTDMNMGFCTSIDVETLVPGSTTVTCSKLISVLKTLSNQPIIFENVENKFKISLESKPRDIMNLKSINSDNFPTLLEDNTEGFKLSQRDFFDMINKTSFAASVGTDKVHLTGMYLHKKDDLLVMVATDGYKLGVIKKAFEQSIPDFKPCIISVKFLSSLIQLGEGEGLLTIGISDTHIFANINGRTLYSSLIIGNYPIYERFIPLDNNIICKVKTSEISEVINRAYNFIDKNSKTIYLELSPAGLIVSSENDDYGDIKNSVDCDYNHSDLTIKFNCNYLINIIKHMDTDYFSFYINENKNTVILAPDPERDYKYMLMRIS